MKLLGVFLEVGWNRELSSLHQSFLKVIGVGLYLLEANHEKGICQHECKNECAGHYFDVQKFWADQGAMLMEAYDTEKGAGTMSPYTFLRANGPEPWNAAYVEPSRRPADGRYGDNPNRLYQHHQFQVVMKPSPDNIQELYLDSLKALGIDPLEHDIRFVEDNWENPSMGAAGIGWEIWLDGMEVTQFTYFQQVGGIQVDAVTSEITYGLERLASYIQDVPTVYDLEWGNGVLYGDIFKEPEYEHSVYSFEESDQEMLLRHFNEYDEAEAKKGLEKALWFTQLTTTF